MIRNKSEFQVREFLFTADEIDEDFKNFENLRNLNKVLKPVASVASMMSLEEKHFKEDSQQLKMLMKSQIPEGLTNN